MFEDATLSSAQAIHSKQGWTTLVSFTIQGLFVGALLILPMIFTDVLPLRHVAEFLRVPTAAPKAIEIVASTTEHLSRTVDSSLTTPLRIPATISLVIDPMDIAPEAVDPNAIAVVGATGMQPLLGNILEVARPREVSIQPIVIKPPMRVSSGVVSGLALSQLRPEYPQTARVARIQGPVVLHAVIAKDGSIQSLKVVSGNPLLIEAALRAVRQWKYRPYLLNGEAIEVETEITVNFTLGG